MKKIKLTCSLQKKICSLLSESLQKPSSCSIFPTSCLMKYCFMLLWSATDPYTLVVSLWFDFNGIHSVCACTLQKDRIHLKKPTRNWACNECRVIHSTKQLTLWLCFEPVQLSDIFKFTLTWGCCINCLVSHSPLVSYFYTLEPSFWRQFIPNLICKTWTKFGFLHFP